MAILRLVDGSSLTVKRSVAELLEALASAGDGGFLELPGEDGSVHVRPSAVIAVVDGPEARRTGFVRP